MNDKFYNKVEGNTERDLGLKSHPKRLEVTEIEVMTPFICHPYLFDQC